MEILFLKKEVNLTKKWWIYYKDGSRTMDLEMSQSAYTLGFSNEEIIDAMADQLRQVSRVIPYWEESNSAIEEAKNSIGGSGEWSKLQWSVSGTSAVEAAIGMSDHWHSSQGNDKPLIISYTPVWHGTSYLTLGLSNQGIRSWNSSRCVSIPSPTWIDKKDRQDEEIRALTETEHHMRNGNIGAVIFNPISYFNGIMPFSQWWWKKLRSLCDEYNVNMICDDITACWGKCKDWHSYMSMGGGVKPDISALGKAIAGGHAPIGVTVANKKIAKEMSNWVYGHSWNPSMGAIAAINKVTQITKKRDLLGNAHWIQEEHDQMCDRLLLDGLIKSWRSYGCFCAIDLVKDIPQEHYIAKGLSTKYRPNVIKITAPLIADEEYFNDLETSLRGLLE
jgi:adenosylmethionine-8-amino-7-oxononanoate aminotransferase